MSKINVEVVRTRWRIRIWWSWWSECYKWTVKTSHGSLTASAKGRATSFNEAVLSTRRFIKDAEQV